MNGSNVFGHKLQVRNVREGYGEFFYDAGHGATVYKGQWVDDKCEGQGEFQDQDSKYESYSQ